MALTGSEVKALALLDCLQVSAEQGGRLKVTIEIGIIKALALQNLNEKLAATKVLEQCVRLAEKTKLLHLLHNPPQSQ